MNAATSPFVISICFVGAIALIPLVASAGLMQLVRKAIDWMESRWM
jgi:hypothetical protein